MGQRYLQGSPDLSRLVVSEMTTTRSRAAFTTTIGAGLLLACLAVAGGSMQSGSRPATPADPSLQKQPEVVFQVLDAQSSPLVFSRANSARDALGFPLGIHRTGKHVKDTVQRTEYDEVDELDAQGDPLSLTQFDGSGRLRVAVRLDDSPHPAMRIAREAASQVAQRGALTAGLPVGGSIHVDTDVATDGWTVRWERAQNGIVVRGDETRVQVRPDGSIQSLALIEHELAGEPVKRLDSDHARQIVAKHADQWFTSAGSGYTLDNMDVEWVAPNNAFDASKQIDPQPVYRLAWVANVKPSGEASKYMWMVTLYLDARDGSLLGGDFVE